MAFGKSGMEKNIELSFPPFHGVIPTHHSVPLHSTHIGISNSAATGPVQDRASQGDCDWSAEIVAIRQNAQEEGKITEVGIHLELEQAHPVFGRPAWGKTK